LFSDYDYCNKFAAILNSPAVKKLLIILLVLSNFTGVFAQSKLRLGVCIDPIATWFSPKSGSIEKDGSRPGINGGLVIESYFSTNYGFVTGLTITSLGGNLLYKDAVTVKTGESNAVDLTAGTTVAYSISYLSIPVGLKLKSNEIGYFTYFAQIGLLPQFNIGSRANATGSQLSKDNVSEEINLINLSYSFGGGIEYSLGGQTSLMAGFFFNNGFSDVLSNNDYKSAINFLTLRIGMLF
jgi:hypothetical protein